MSVPITVQKSGLIRKLAKLIFKMIGWQSYIITPPTSSYVFIGAPHTTNWDLGILMLFATANKVPVHWMGKDTLFKGPLGFIIRALGGIPVNRSARSNFVDQAAEMFSKEDELIIAMAPEGTRGKTTRWRTGFYYIALKAKVPIVMAYLDYKKKICGLGPAIIPTGDINTDFEKIKDFYKDFTGKYPEKQGEIKLTED
ncbi:MAG TPA: lysophospholipid acyltransferase family protein [Ignavibacteriaceae bacterium]|nr:lysophospholipid acyltransferase family protein [Ignavibacteriaceae bacterium]